MNLEGGPDGYAVVMPDGNFVGIWRERDIAEKIANRGRMSKDERIVPVYFDVPVTARPEAQAQLLFAYEAILTEMRTYACVIPQVAEWVKRMDFARDEARHNMNNGSK